MGPFASVPTIWRDRVGLRGHVCEHGSMKNGK